MEVFSYERPMIRVNMYLANTKMELLTMEGTDVELMAAAQVLGIDTHTHTYIYMYIYMYIYIYIYTTNGERNESG